MKLKILGASHHIVTTPTYDPRGQPTGNKETGLLELIKFRPTTILDMGEISTAAAEAINAAYFAPPVPQRTIPDQQAPVK